MMTTFRKFITTSRKTNLTTYSISLIKKYQKTTFFVKIVLITAVKKPIKHYGY